MQEPCPTPDTTSETFGRPSDYQKPSLTSLGSWQVLTGSVVIIDFE